MMNFSGISRSSLIGRWMRYPLKLLPQQMAVPILQGALRGKRWIVGSSTHGCWLGSYEYEKQRLFQRIVKPGSVLYDIGAHVGFYTLLGSLIVGERGRVVAFEPAPHNLQFLYRHLSLNRLNNVTVVEAAVSDETGYGAFDFSSDSSAGFIAENGNMQVRLFQLDEGVDAENLPPPDFIKIDIEGGEEKALLGAIRLLEKYHPTIFLATHSDIIHQNCVNFLVGCGYTLTPVGANSIEETDEIVATYLG